ncbi:MAG: hypothetical protein RR857_21015 [Comamonas sp.]
MFRPIFNHDTQSKNSTESSSNSNPPTHPENFIGKQIAVQERIKFIISKIESFQNNFATTTAEINNLTDKKESHETALQNLYNNLKPSSTRSDSNAWQQAYTHHKKEVTNTIIIINIFTSEKHSCQKSLEISKIELLQCIDELKTTKIDAITDKKIEYLLSIAKQKIAAADFSIAADNANQAQKDFSNIKHLPYFPPDKPHKASSAQLDQVADHISKQTLSHFIKYIPKETINRSELRLNEKEPTLHQLEKILQESNLAVEKAKIALDQCILNAVLANSTDDAFLTTPAAPTMPVDTLAIDEAQDYEPVIATGMDEHLELI